MATIVPGSSPGGAFVVQVIRPRLGLPLGGLFPPQLFGLEEELTFHSTTPCATIGTVTASRIELSADRWELVLVIDDDGRVSPETYLVFKFVFENRLRKVRCLPDDPVVGTLDTTKLATTGKLSGRFDIELTRCEDAKIGESLNWPPSPLIVATMVVK